MLICRFARELTVNALKHSHAARIDVKLQQEHDDDYPAKYQTMAQAFRRVPDDHSPHHGLASIQEQVIF